MVAAANIVASTAMEEPAGEVVPVVAARCVCPAIMDFSTVVIRSIRYQTVLSGLTPLG